MGRVLSQSVGLRRPTTDDVLRFVTDDGSGDVLEFPMVRADRSRAVNVAAERGRSAELDGDAV